MANRKSTKKALFMSAVSLLLCVSMFVGTTFAWFTDSVSSVNNIITAGNLDVELEYWNGKEYVAVGDTNLFKEDTLWEPGHTEVVHLRVRNAGTLALKYQLGINVVSEVIGKNAEGKPIRLSEFLQFGVILTDTIYETREAARAAVQGTHTLYEGWSSKDEPAMLDPDQLAAGSKDTTQKLSEKLLPGDDVTLALVVFMPEDVGNEANYRIDDPNVDKIPMINMGITLIATQQMHENDSYGPDYDENAFYWDSLADTSWYEEADPDATEFVLSTPHQVAGLSELVDGGETFDGKTIRLNADVDLAGHIFNPIGSARGVGFMGTFDGQGHTISNISQNTWALDNGYYYGDLGLGLFSAVRDAEIKNLTVDGASISGESAICGAVAATAYGDCTFENITVKNSKVNDYQYYAGGVVGWASGNHTYKNINLDSSVVVGSQWGDFGNANGGIIGGAGTDGTYSFEDCTVACRIDATNDVVSAYQWYNYRNSGMLIGRVGPATVVNGEVMTVPINDDRSADVTCKNVTVIYGNWANYTYCEFGGNGYPYVRVQPGVSVDGYSNVRYGHPTDANGNLVVDDNHVHNAGEAHHKVVAFDQLFGGPGNHRYSYYGISEYSGVTVIYPTTDATFTGAFEFDDGTGNKKEDRSKIGQIIFGKPSEYPDIVNNYIPVTDEKGIATYQVPNGDKYDIYYLSENKIMMPANSKSLFEELTNMTEFDASNLDMSQVENVVCMFLDCKNLETIKGIENWDMSNVTNMQSMFYGCNKLENIDVSKWDTSNVTNMRMVFFRCYELSNDVLKGVENWDVSNVTNFYSMFKHARGLTELDLSKWDTSNATNMSHLFANIGGLEKLDLSSFDTSKVTDMSWMFYDASKLTTIYVGDGWTTAALDPANPTCFYNNQALVGGNGTTWLDVCDMANPARPWESSAKITFAVVDGGTSNPGLFTYKTN